MATINKTAKTKKPSGLAIVRDSNLKFCMSWKIADQNYSKGHQLRWRVWTTEKKSTKWTTVTLGSAATKKSIALSSSDYYPTAKKPNVYAFEFETRGKRNPTTQTQNGDTIITTYDWSAWNGKKWLIKEPNKPSLTATLTASYTTNFVWTGNNDSTDNRPFSRFEYQMVLIRACKITDGSKVTGWSSTTTANSDGNKSQAESNISTDSYTRWFRIRAVGAGGASGWVYAKHVYAKPYKPTISKLEAKTVSSTTNVFAKWTAKADAAHPIDQTVVEYAISTGTTYASTGTTGITLNDTTGTDSASFKISSVLDYDQCLFVRVKNEHDTDINTGNWVATDWKVAQYGQLKTPSNLTVTLTNSTTVSVAVTNESTVSTSRVAIIYRGTNGKDITVAVTSAGNGAKSLTGVRIPTTAERTTVTFYAYAFVGSYTEKTRTDSAKQYTIDATMTSAKLKDSVTSPAVPVAPGAVSVTQSGSEAFMVWNNTWADATQTELSWSKNPNAWESTEQPQTYVIQDKNAQQWRIANVEPGYVWYFRARFINASGDNPIYAPYCDLLSLDLTAEPDKPILKLSKPNVAPNGNLNATWTYSCADGIAQGSAQLARVTNPGQASESYSAPFATTASSKSKSFSVKGWTSGQNHYVAVRTTSLNSKTSEWSDPVPVYVGAPITMTLTTSLSNVTITDSDSGTRTALSLTALPLTVTATGAGNGGTTTLVIERDDEYHMERPDNSMMDGYAGETIAVYSQIGEAQMSIDQNLMNGRFDDGAKYRLTVTAEDGNGQSAQMVTKFEVHWNHQAAVPTASVVMENGVAKITATAPTGTVTGDGCDIYRLSVDNPQLIVQGGAFGTAYVDPYPALGENGGYRIVDVTKYGDYITAGDQPAWVDIPINLDNKTGYIHFNGESIPVTFNVELSSSWSKDFKETKYLGGAVRGDWNPAVSRSTNVNVVLLSNDTESIQAMRRLADWPGICHVRTQDGSSFTADVQVTGNTGVSVAGKIETYSLKITRVEPQELDGLPYSEWVTQ